jgi:ClpP class serine protease
VPNDAPDPNVRAPGASASWTLPADMPPKMLIPPGVPPVGVAAAEPMPQPDDKETTVALIEALEHKRGNRVLVYWTSDLARMSDAVVRSFYDQLCAIGDVPHLDLVLQTSGGDMEIPWRLTSLIREFAKRFTVIVAHRAASSGTLLAMGADEIVMTRFAVLGPIDPRRNHPLLPVREGMQAEPVSVQDMRHAMQFIREAGRAGSEFAYTPEAMAQIFTSLFDELHPLVIGAIEQSHALSKLIGTRCLETHMKGSKAEKRIASLVDKLCDEYKSHAYQIPRAEAKSIGLKVKSASPKLDELVMRLYRHYTSRPLRPPILPPDGGQLKAHIAWLDTTEMQLRCVANQVSSGGRLQSVSDRWERY